VLSAKKKSGWTARIAPTPGVEKNHNWAPNPLIGTITQRAHARYTIYASFQIHERRFTSIDTQYAPAEYTAKKRCVAPCLEPAECETSILFQLNLFL
jgi:hypothetical protein